MRGVAATSHPDPSLVVSGMNDVLNSQGYTEAAWLDLIPVSAWVPRDSRMPSSQAVRGERLSRQAALLLVLPMTISLSLALIADIDSPRGG